VLLLAPSGHAGADPVGIALSLVAGGALLAAGLAFSALMSGDGGEVVDEARAATDAGPAVAEPLSEAA
jgi:hypothetical protein